MRHKCLNHWYPNWTLKWSQSSTEKRLFPFNIHWLWFRSILHVALSISRHRFQSIRNWLVSVIEANRFYALLEADSTFIGTLKPFNWNWQSPLPRANRLSLSQMMQIDDLMSMTPHYHPHSKSIVIQYHLNESFTAVPVTMITIPSMLMTEAKKFVKQMK